MPCNGGFGHHDYGPGKDAKEASCVAELLAELDGEAPPNPESYGTGYHPRTYGNPDVWDDMTAELCRRLRAVEDEEGFGIGRYSLEMQIWWRDHQKRDAEREERERTEELARQARLAALAKLSLEERKVLGL